MGSSHDSSFQRINPREKGDWKSGDQVARVPRKGGQAHEELWLLWVTPSLGPHP